MSGTRSAEQIRQHFRMAGQLAQDPVQIDFRYAPTLSEVVLLTLDRESLFADVAGALAAWGMNIVTADAVCERARHCGRQLSLHGMASARSS